MITIDGKQIKLQIWDTVCCLFYELLSGSSLDLKGRVPYCGKES